jgi:hypothetical protein
MSERRMTRSDDPAGYADNLNLTLAAGFTTR